MKPWWEKWPGRLEYELAELKAAGIESVLDMKAIEKGVVVFGLRYPIAGDLIEFIVRFPDVYPYMRFEIYAPQLSLGHHQNPFAKNLCMIGRSTANWRTTDTVAHYIVDRLPSVLQAGQAIDQTSVKEVEEIQGEPITAYYPYAPNQVVLVDSSWRIDASINKGLLRLGAHGSNTCNPKFAVLSVMDNNNKVLAEAGPGIANLYTDDHVAGKWIRSPEPIIEINPNDFLRRLADLDRLLLDWKALSSTKFFFIGLLFPEEVQWRENKDGWLFMGIRRRGK